MYDPVILTVIFRGALAFVLALIGGWCVYLSYLLIFRTAGDRVKSTFEAAIGSHKISFSTGTAGTAVLFVSAVWAVSALFAAPKIMDSPEGTMVTFGPGVKGLTGIENIAAVEFKGNNTSLTDGQKKYLHELLSQVYATGGAQKFIVEAYAEPQQTNELSLSIAQKRAEAVKHYLVKEYSIDPEQVRVISYGEERPLSKGIIKNTVIVTAIRKKDVPKEKDTPDP